MLTAATPKAAAAARHNHVFLPGGGYRIVAPGLALIHDVLPEPLETARQVRLMGKTGVVAETLLLGGVARGRSKNSRRRAGSKPPGAF